MSDLIRRYEIVMFENDWMRKESPAGDYVRYEDHAVEVERLTAELKHAKEMERVWKANAEALADVANKADARVEELEGVINTQASRLMTVQRGEKIAFYELRLDVADKLIAATEQGGE